MRRAGAVALAVAFAAGLAVAIAGAARADRPEALPTGMFPAVLLAPLNAGERICQTPLSTPEPMEAVTFVFGPAGEIRGPHEVTVRAAAAEPAGSGRVLAEGTIPRQVLSGGEVTARLERPVGPGRTVTVCVEERGAETAELWGDTAPERTPSNSGAIGPDGAPIAGDVFLRFPDPDGGSLLERIPAAFEHAAPYKLGGIGAWLFWALAALVVVGGPVLLARALMRAAAPAEAES